MSNHKAYSKTLWDEVSSFDFSTFSTATNHGAKSSQIKQAMLNNLNKYPA